MSRSSSRTEQRGTPNITGSGTGKLPPMRSQRRRHLLEIIAALIALALLLAFMLIIFNRSMATVALTPASKTVSATNNVPARILTSAQHGPQTASANGSESLPSSFATGILTFENDTAWDQTIPVGTAFTNSNGIVVVTDRTILVPKDPPFQPGYASVSAHAKNPGKSGNIQALSVEGPCCYSRIFVLNPIAFSGGRAAQTVPFVQQSDIDKAVSIEQESLMPVVQNAIQTQLKPGERLVNGTNHCSTSVTSNHKVGDIVTSLTVNITLVCSTAAYNQQLELTNMRDVLNQKAIQGLGPGFNSDGLIVINVEQFTLDKNGKGMLVVSGSGTWKYQFTSDRKTKLAKMIARKSIDDAKSILLKQAGISAVSISVSIGITIPDDIRRITMIG